MDFFDLHFAECLYKQEWSKLCGTFSVIPCFLNIKIRIITFTNVQKMFLDVLWCANDVIIIKAWSYLSRVDVMVGDATGDHSRCPALSLK